MWNIKKKDAINFFAEQILTHRLKHLRFPKETGWRWGDGLGVWDGNALKLGCDDRRTTREVIKFIELKKKTKDVTTRTFLHC